MRRRVSGILLSVFVLGALGFVALLTSETLQDRLATRIAARRVGRDLGELLDGRALRLFFCGTGSPLPDPRRGQSCLAVFAGETLLLVDAGAGAGERFARFHVPAGQLAGVLFTHFHSDHVTGLPDIALNSWIAGRAEPLRLYGGPGIDQVARGFAIALSQDSQYRLAHHGHAVLPEAAVGLVPVTVDIPPGETAVTVIDNGDLRVRAFRVYHPPVDPAYGYRIDYRGRSVIVSGDTARTTTLETVGRDVDVMVHEALAPHLVEIAARALEDTGDGRRARLLRDTPGYHTTPVEAAEVANAAHARLLVLTHLVPPVTGAFPERVFMRGVSRVRPKDTLLAHDGLLIELPVDSKAIQRRMLRE